MADNDYLGGIQNQQWNTYNAGWLRQTPNWMQGRFKQGTPVSSARFQPGRAGVSQSWDGGQIRDTRTKPMAAEAVNRIGQGIVDRNLNVQASKAAQQQQAQAGQRLASAWQNLPQQAQAAQMTQQYASAFKPAPPAPSTSLTTGVGAINQNLARWQSPPVASNPLLSGYQKTLSQAAVAPMQQQYTNPGAPPRTFNPTPMQQQAIAGIQAQRQRLTSPATSRASKRSFNNTPPTT